MLVAVSKDHVLDFVKLNGPVVPNDIKKKLGSDTMIIGAVLSELVSEKKLKVSYTKVGGSPAYYSPGSEHKLQNIAKFLNEKDLRAYELLRGKGILRDYDLSPLMRVAMRSIKDYAMPVEVQAGEHRELFWKWYLITNQQAEQLIRQEIEPAKQQVKEEAKSLEQPIPSRELKPALVPETKPVQSMRQQPEPVPVHTRVQQAVIPKEEQRIIPEVKQPAAKKGKAKKPGPLLEAVTGFFEKNHIDILETNVIKKASEIDFIITVPSAIGKARYYCKAKSKKSITEGDLSTAYVAGESRKLPVLFLSNGMLNKRAKEMLSQEFKSMSILQLGKHDE